MGVECVVGAWLLKARPLPPSGPGPFPNPTQRNNAPPRGWWPLWAGGQPPCQRARPAAPGLGPCALGASRVKRGCGAVPLLTVVRGRRRALGAAHRHAAGETRGGLTAAAGVPSSWTLPLGCSRDSHSARAASRREGLRPKIGTLQLFFLQLGHEVPTHFFFKHTPAHFRTFSSAL